MSGATKGLLLRFDKDMGTEGQRQNIGEGWFIGLTTKTVFSGEEER